MKIKQKDKAER